MSVMPGSLDYLYYNGILDHIPYEAYESTPMNGSQYLNQAKQGLLYDTYTSPDTFVKRNNTDYKQSENYSFSKSAFGLNNGVGKDSDFEVNAVGQEGKSFRESLVESAKTTASGFNNAPTFVKGLIAGGIMVGTLFCLLRGKKKPPVEEVSKPSFWSKLNPKNWFKKKA